MIIPAEISRRFRLSEPARQFLETQVEDSVFSYARKNGYAYVGRLKAADSLAEKIESGRYSNWSSIDDLFACTIVIPTLSEEAAVLEFLQKAFVERQVRHRASTKKPPDVFRFEATRFVGMLNPTKGEVAEEASTLMFEVQVRTAFEHAWSVTTHALAYKSQKVDWRRLRLAAQLKAAVEQLDSLVLAFEQSIDPIIKHTWNEVELRAQVASVFSELAHNGMIPTESLPRDMSRFVDNFVALARSGAEKHDSGKRVEESLKVIYSEIRRMDGSGFPKSISLLQVCLGIFIDCIGLPAKLDNYYPLVTTELVSLYPKATKLLDGAFKFD